MEDESANLRRRRGARATCGWVDLGKGVAGSLGRCLGTRGVLFRKGKERVLDERCASPSSDKNERRRGLPFLSLCMINALAGGSDGARGEGTQVDCV